MVTKPPAPTPKKAQIQTAKGRPPRKENTRGKVVEKTEAAPKSAPSNPKRPDVSRTHEYLDSVKPGEIRSESKRLIEQLKQASEAGDHVRQTQLKDALAGLKDKANAAGMGPKDLPELADTSTLLQILQAVMPGFGGKKPPARAPAAPTREARGSGGAYIKARPIRVKCFKKNTKGDPKEYDKQLADQEKGLNDLTVKEYLEGRQKYQEIGRKGTGAAQAQARAAYNAQLQSEFKKQLNRQGITGGAAQQQAAQMTSERMSTLAALHNPDMIAGGKDVVTTMGDKGVNSSIGSQWKDRVGELDKAAMEVPEHERATTKMNAKLKRCR